MGGRELAAGPAMRRITKNTCQTDKLILTFELECHLQQKGVGLHPSKTSKDRVYNSTNSSPTSALFETGYKGPKTTNIDKRKNILG
jgi:hypothetical protein